MPANANNTPNIPSVMDLNSKDKITTITHNNEIKYIILRPPQ